MANEWLRLWHDMPTDPKWRTISRISKQPISLVIATYTHLLVAASQSVTRGHTNIATEDLASSLDVTDEEIQSILDAMQGRVLDGNKLLGWERRQPKREDVGNYETGVMSATERKRLQRSRKKSNVTDVTENVTCHKMSQNSHVFVTEHSAIFGEKTQENSSQGIDNADMSQMSRNVTTDKDKDKDKDIKEKALSDSQTQSDTQSDSLVVHMDEVEPKEAKQLSDKRSVKTIENDLAISDIFDYWKTIMNHQRSILDDKRKKQINDALKTGYSVDDLKSAILGCSLTPHNMGVNESNSPYDGIHIIFKDAGNIDRFIANSINPPQKKLNSAFSQGKGERQISGLQDAYQAFAYSDIPTQPGINYEN